MIPPQGFGGPPPAARIMAFIDGGYLRAESKKRIDTDSINYSILKDRLVSEFNANCNGMYRGDLIRAYYYDGAVSSSSPKSKEQEQYFSKIRDINSYEVRLGRLKPTGDNQNGSLKQKGVDVLLSVDMITKAYLNHYDFAILLAGDDDFLDVVKAVKDTGKRVFGIYFREHISEELFSMLDARMAIDNFINSLKA